MYVTDGEHSDWILTEFGIIAVTPEIGTNNPRSNMFYIMDKTLLCSILNSNTPWVVNSFRKLGF
jgi:hypothetical protein